MYTDNYFHETAVTYLHDDQSHLTHSNHELLMTELGTEGFAEDLAWAGDNDCGFFSQPDFIFILPLACW